MFNNDQLKITNITVGNRNRRTKITCRNSV